MGELSTAAQGAGDMTADTANAFIVAADKAYHMKGSVEKLTETLDGINYITNHNAVNMSELSEGFSIVASTAASFGIQADQLTAALGTMSAVTHHSGSQVARAFKAILLNIRQVSDEEEGIDAEGLTKYEAACNALGVSLKETKDGVLQTRDAMEVLKELSVEYSKLSEDDLRRTNLLNSVGGKLRSTQLDALLRNWDTYESMLQQYADGSGSMAREADKTAKSLEGSLNRLSNTWTDTVENVLNADDLTTIVDGLNGILNVINFLTEKLGTLGTIGLGAGIFAGIKNVGRTKMYVLN
jgi:TP901 family phage tail tape measure protein